MSVFIGEFCFVDLRQLIYCDKIIKEQSYKLRFCVLEIVKGQYSDYFGVNYIYDKLFVYDRGLECYSVINYKIVI